MEEVRCMKCGRPLRDPDSIARGMGPECAGVNGGHRRRYHARVSSHGSSYYAAVGHGSTIATTLFTLVKEGQHIEERPLVEEVLPRKSALAEILMQFPTDLINLVVFAPAAGAITWHVKNYSKKKKKQKGRCLQARFCRKFAECAST